MACVQGQSQFSQHAHVVSYIFSQSLDLHILAAYFSSCYAVSYRMDGVNTNSLLSVGLAKHQLQPRRTRPTPCLKKTVQLIFGQNFVKFRPIVEIFGTKIAKKTSFSEVYSFSTSPNLCQRTTVLNGRNLTKFCQKNKFAQFF